MNSNTLKILCILIAVIIMIPPLAIAANAAKGDKKAFDADSEGGGPKNPNYGGAKHSNLQPIVNILKPTDTVVYGDYLEIVVSVWDEDEGSVAVISVDLIATFNNGNSVIIDISGWESGSEHFISAAYTDSFGKTGGDTQFIVKA